MKLRHFLAVSLLFILCVVSGHSQGTVAYTSNPVIQKGMKYQGAYAGGTTYAINDVVVSSGVSYVSLINNNVGNSPASNPSDWSPLSTAASTGVDSFNTRTGAVTLTTADVQAATAVTAASNSAASGEPLTSSGTTNTAQWAGLVFYQQSGDTVSNVEAKCTSPCLYHMNGQLTVAASHTLASNVVLDLQGGGGFNITSGTLTLSASQISASSTLTRHFFGNSTVVGLSGLVPVEWFGAVSYTSPSACATGTDSTDSIQAAIDSITLNGQAELQGFCYRTIETITISTNGNGIVGPIGSGQMDPGLAAKPGAQILNTTNSNTIISYHGGSRINRGQLSNFVASRSIVPIQGAHGIEIIDTCGVGALNVYSNDSTSDWYFDNAFGCGNPLQNVVAQWGFGLVPIGDYASLTVAAYEYDSEDGNCSCSLVNQNSEAAMASPFGGTVTSYGYWIHGKAINDLNFLGIFTGTASYGAYINYTGTGADVTEDDIHLYDATFDNCFVSCVYVTGLSNINRSGPAVIIDRGYFVIDAANSSAIIDIESSQGIFVINSDMENLSSLGGTGDIGVVAHNSANLNISGNHIQNLGGTGINIDGTIASVFNNNVIDAASGFPFVFGIKAINSSTYNTIVGNSFSGSITTAALSFDGTSLSNDVVGNTCFSSVSACLSGTPAGTTPSFLGPGSQAAGIFKATGTAGGFNAPLYTPLSSSATCAVGTTAWDDSFVYICTAANTWKRVALAAF